MITFYTQQDATYTWADVKPTHPPLTDEQRLYAYSMTLWKKANKFIDEITSSTDERWNFVRTIQNLAIEYDDAAAGKLPEWRKQELLRGISDE